MDDETREAAEVFATLRPSVSRPAAASDAAAVVAAPAAAASASSSSAAGGSTHRFWSTQPVPKEPVTSDNGPIDAAKTVEEVRPEPYVLPGGFTWVAIDVHAPEQLAEMYALLLGNYVEDDDAAFRFKYSAEFLLWALTPPGYFPDWLVGVRNKAGKLQACITGVPAHMSIHGKEVLVCEINFLCVHKSLRSKRLAPVLIKEVTRRVNLRNIWQAAYTAGVVIPKPIASCQYFHRSINPQKLVDIRFSALGRNMTMARSKRLYAVPDEAPIKGVKPLEPKHVPAACALVNTYLERFPLHPVFNEADFSHWLLPRPNVISSFVVENDDGVVTDFFSFYHLPSSVLGHAKHTEMLAAYCYYVAPMKHSMLDIMSSALVYAKMASVDVFNALDVMENGPLFKDLKFLPGDGHLQYYLYNWACPDMPPSGVGLVLL